MATRIRCGSCGESHETVAAVRSCHENKEWASHKADFAAREAEQEAAAFATGDGVVLAQVHRADINAPTEKQLSFMRKLLAEREHTYTDGTVQLTIQAGKRAVSQLIDSLCAMPQKSKTVAELEDGIYEKDGVYFKVYHTVHGANQQVAKRLIVTKTDDVHPASHPLAGQPVYKGEWEYEGKRPLHALTVAHKLPEEEAKKFGQVYGFCVNCAATLTREQSLHVGYGPTCANNNGWWYPSKAELKALAQPLSIDGSGQ